MFKIIQKYEIPVYDKEGYKVYQFYFHPRRTMDVNYTAYCIADSIISAKQKARELCRNNGYTLDKIEKYWHISDTITELKEEEVE